MRRIALVRADRIGDAVLASCAIADVRRAFPDTAVVWVVREGVAPLFSGPDFPARLEVVRDNKSAKDQAKRFASLNLDAVVFLNPHPEIEAAMAAAGVPVRIGLAAPASAPGSLTATLALDKDAGVFHEARCGRKLLALLPGFALDESAPLEPCLAPDAAALDEVVTTTKTLLHDDGTAAEPFAVFHAGAHGEKTRLPHRVFQEAAHHLVKRHRMKLVLVGAPAGPADLPPGMIPDILDLRGKLSLGATAHLLRAASVVLSRDSGPAHIAAAMGAPTVGVFLEAIPAMGPRRWAPLGPCVRTVLTPATPRWYEHFNYAAYRRRAAAAITPAAVIAAIDALLA